MQSASESEFSAMLLRLREGDPEASRGLVSLLYSELHRLARWHMAEQPEAQTLQATALVSEAYLRLVGTRRQTWTDRKHLLTAAASAMRWVLVDHARKRANRKLAEADRLALDRVLVTYESTAIDMVALDGALAQLAVMSPEMARAVELRFFAGLSMEEVADVLDMPRRTLTRQWETARIWLFERMS